MKRGHERHIDDRWYRAELQLSERLLTPREREVLCGLGDGLTYEAIAKKHFVSLSTVRTQARSMLKKLGAKTAAQAVMVAWRRGLFGPAGSDVRAETHRLLDELLDEMFDGQRDEARPPTPLPPRSATSP